MAAIAILRRHVLRPSLKLPMSLSRSLSATMTRSYTFDSYLVTPAQLSDALQKNVPSKLSTAPQTIAVCGSWFLPNDPEKRNGSQVYKKAHIPDARFFDLDKISDTSSPYPHMLPSPEVFSEAMSELGIKRDDTVVVYDSQEIGIFSAPRVAWTFKVFGHKDVHILNNFRLWVEQGHETESGEQKAFEKTEYKTPELEQKKVCAFEEVKRIASDHNKEGSEGVQILDARSEGRWKGVESEPRPGLSSGHMPGSISVPVPLLLDPKTKAFLSSDELRKVFQQRGVDPNRPIISSCGTGVTAAVIDAALAEAAYGSVDSYRVYDGSWTEWAQRVQPSDNLIISEGAEK